MFIDQENYSFDIPVVHEKRLMGLKSIPWIIIRNVATCKADWRTLLNVVQIIEKKGSTRKMALVIAPENKQVMTCFQGLYLMP